MNTRRRPHRSLTSCPPRPPRPSFRPSPLAPPPRLPFPPPSPLPLSHLRPPSFPAHHVNQRRLFRATHFVKLSAKVRLRTATHLPLFTQPHSCSRRHPFSGGLGPLAFVHSAHTHHAAARFLILPDTHTRTINGSERWIKRRHREETRAGSGPWNRRYVRGVGWGVGVDGGGGLD